MEQKRKKFKPNFIQTYFDKRLANKIIKRYLSLDKSMWLNYAHTFNGWHFPFEFYDLIPRWWRYGNPEMERAMTIYRITSKFINKHFTEKEQLRFHNVCMGKMTEAEFEYWFDNFSMKSGKLNNNDYGEFYDKRKFIDSIHWWEDNIFEKIKTVLC